MINNIRLISASEGYTFVYKLAKDITKEDLMLIARNFTIEFHDRPIDDRNYAYITVSLIQEGAEPIASTFGVNFDDLAEQQMRP